MNPEKARDYKKMAEDVIRGWQFQEIPELPATLFQDDQIVSKGLVVFSNDPEVIFFPKPPKRLDSLLHGKVTVRVMKNGDVLNLKHSYDLFNVGDDKYWYFEKVA